MIQAINATNSHHFRKEISKHKSYEKSPFCQKKKECLIMQGNTQVVH